LFFISSPVGGLLVFVKQSDSSFIPSGLPVLALAWSPPETPKGRPLLDVNLIMVRLQVCIQHRLDVIFGLLSSAVRRNNGSPDVFTGQ
jgi:hypothetical protein